MPLENYGFICLYLLKSRITFILMGDHRETKEVTWTHTMATVIRLDDTRSQGILVEVVKK